MLAAIWVVAALGILMKLYRADLHVLSGVMYLGLGWAAVIASPQFVRVMSPATLILTVAGGLLYSFGALVLALAPAEALPADVRLSRALARGHRGGGGLPLCGRAADPDRRVRLRGTSADRLSQVVGCLLEIPRRCARSGVF